MAITKQQARRTSQSMFTGDIQQAILNASDPEVIMIFSNIAEKISFQASGDLAGTVEFSLNGKDFKESVAIPASNAIENYDSSLVKAVKISRTSGTGRIVVAAL